MNNYKFGNYICKLREDHNLTQAELAKLLNVSDKAVSKWENGQAIPRMETLEKLAETLNTSIEDIFSASKDNITRICIVNDFCSIMQIDINNKIYTIKFDDCQWIEVDSTDLTVRITGDMITDEDFEELQKEANSLKDKVILKITKKTAQEILKMSLQVNCTYTIQNIKPDSVLKICLDTFSLGDKMLTYQNFVVSYPKIECDCQKTELQKAKGKNSKEVIRAFQLAGLASDAGMDFISMLLFYPVRGVYFKHLCNPKALKKNILRADEIKIKNEKEKKQGCFSGCLIPLLSIFLCFILVIFIFPIMFVKSEQPYLVASDYSTITYFDDVYVRIADLPHDATPTLAPIFNAIIWESTRTDGLPRWEQATEDNKVMLYESTNSNAKYLWYVENYADTILGYEEDKEYKDFDKHYVYVCENPER